VSRRAIQFVLLAAVLLLGSRLPFFGQNVAWGIFDLEHTWIITDSSVVERAHRVAPELGLTLAELDHPLFGSHYHAGGMILTDMVRLTGRLTGDWSLVRLKLVGLAFTLIALLAYLATVTHVWPGDRRRWALAAWIPWLAPPSLFLWMTLMPMGHYMETWLFHALFLPGFVLVASDRARPVTLFPIGLLAGLAMVYVFSNVMFPALMTAGVVLFSQRSRMAQLRSVGALAAGVLLVWLPFVLPRLAHFQRRVGLTGPSEKTAAHYAQQAVYNAVGLVKPEVVAGGDAFSHRGLFAVLEPHDSALAVVAAYVLALAGVGGAAFLLRSVARLVRAESRAAMPLGERLLALNGLMLLGLLGTYVPVLDGEGTEGRSFQYVSYLTLSYPALLFGVTMGAATLLQWGERAGRRAPAAVVSLIVVLLGVGWAQSVAANLAHLDRPEIQRQEYRRAPLLVRFVGGDRQDQSQAQATCDALFPDNPSFCAATGWRVVVEDRVLSRGVGSLPDFCGSLPPSDQEACWTAIAEELVHHHAGRGVEYGAAAVRAACGPPGTEPAGCLTGAHRVVQRDHPHDIPFWSLMRALAVCEAGNESVPRWAERTCLESVAWTMVGMPPLPATSAAVSPVCTSWPAGWQGLCQGLAGRQPAEPGARSCEDEYIARFVPRIPVRHQLIYQQCAFADLLVDELDLMGIAGLEREQASVLPPCLIGVARALEGLECSWSGADLALSSP